MSRFGPIIKEIGRGAKGARDLPVAEAEALFAAMLAGEVPDLELGAILLALRIKSEADDELLGFCRAMQATTRPLAPPARPLVVLPSYNGTRRQANLMPLLAFMLRDAGFCVLVHGRHDFDARQNPFPLFAACGIEATGDVGQVNAALATHGIALAETRLLNPALDRLLALRTRLGVRNTAHTLCKLLDPCVGHTLRVVNVTHPAYLARMSTLLQAQNATALLLRGTEGEAFANPKRRPELMGFQHGVARQLFAAAEGGTPPLDGLPDTVDIAENAALIARFQQTPASIPQPLKDQVAALQKLADQPL